MIIDPNGTVAGFPSLKVRDFFKKMKRNDFFYIEAVEFFFKISKPNAFKFVKILLREEFISPEKSANVKDGWTLTLPPYPQDWRYDFRDLTAS